jgi:hypothetical protein
MNLLSVILLVGVIGFAAMGAEPIPFKVLVQGGHSGVDERREVVARTAEEFKALDVSPPPDGAPPKIDFATTMVVGVYMGTRPSGGHSVEITRIERESADLVVTYRERAPGPNEIATMVMTSPFQLVTTATFPGRVRFVRAR